MTKKELEKKVLKLETRVDELLKYEEKYDSMAFENSELNQYNNELSGKIENLTGIIGQLYLDRKHARERIEHIQRNQSTDLPF